MKQDGSEMRSRTKQVLSELFPEIGTTLTVSEVREVLKNTPGVTTKADQLTILRQELGIVSRPIRIRGISGVSHWEWTREFQIPEEPKEPKKETRGRKKKPEEPDWQWVPETERWITLPIGMTDGDEIENYKQAYLQDPQSFDGQQMTEEEFNAPS